MIFVDDCPDAKSVMDEERSSEFEFEKSTLIIKVKVTFDIVHLHTW